MIPQLELRALIILQSVPLYVDVTVGKLRQTRYDNVENSELLHLIKNGFAKLEGLLKEYKSIRT